MIYPIFFIAVGFLSGGILFSYHIPKWLCGVDVVAESADHNPGTYNAVKLCGLRIGLLCLLLDLAKGFVPVFLALRVLRIEDPWVAPVLAAPVLGHAMALFYPFAGGKAVAVSFGALLGLLPWSPAVLALALPYVFFSTILVLQPHERRTVLSFFCMAVLCLLGAVLWTHRMSVTLGASLVALTAMWKNRPQPVAVEEPAALAQKGKP
ncbi:MAG: glycerol-3-phosphate acyltransferase [Candidatus Spyradocola sp.]|jgi:glycerol-3-phosphate acyltransferase PlsY